MELNVRTAIAILCGIALLFLSRMPGLRELFTLGGLLGGGVLLIVLWILLPVLVLLLLLKQR